MTFSATVKVAGRPVHGAEVRAKTLTDARRTATVVLRPRTRGKWFALGCGRHLRTEPGVSVCIVLQERSR